MSSSHSIPHKPAELFRSDLISAMKLADSTPLESSSFVTIKEQWRTEWEVGVQVCVSPDHILEASARTVQNPPTPSEDYECAQRYIHEDEESNDYVMYDLDELDLNWLQSVNFKRKFRALAGSKGLEEDTLRESLLFLETKCQQGMARAVATEDTLGIEYDEQTICDVCRDEESEETNDMIFCDSCNVCVHQACYGVPSIPMGEWLCKPCSMGDESANCVLCPVKGGALKRVRPGNMSWAHLCCALWIPEVRVGNAEKMEPITNIDAVPPNRRNLACCICRMRHGACIRCSHPVCAIAYHVTCGFQHGLDMKSRLDMLTNAVIHESYCPKHTAMRKSPSKSNFYSPLHGKDGLGGLGTRVERPSQLVQLQEQFYNYASGEDLVDKFKLSPKLSTLIYNYWKLKRKFQHNRPLLSHLPIETSLESIKAELAAGGIKYGMDVDESFLKIVHIRQNLEKARNLVYMVQRRERLKKQLLMVQSDRIQLEAKLLDAPDSREETSEDTRGSIVAADAAVGPEVKTRSRSCSTSHLGSSSETDEEVTVRKTRSMTQQGSGTSGSVPPLATSIVTSTNPASNSLDHNHHQQQQQQYHSHHHQQQQHQHHQPHHSQQQQQQKQNANHLPSAGRQTMLNGSSSQSSDHQHINSLVKESRNSRTLSSGRIAGADTTSIHRKELRKDLKIHAKLANPEPSILQPRVTRSSALGRQADSGSSSNEDEVGVARHHSCSGDERLIASRDKDRQGLGLNGKATVNGSIGKLEFMTESGEALSSMNCKKGSPEAANLRKRTICTLKDSSLILSRNRTALNLRIRPYNINHRGSGSNKS